MGCKSWRSPSATKIRLSRRRGRYEDRLSITPIAPTPGSASSSRSSSVRSLHAGGFPASDRLELGQHFVKAKAQIGQHMVRSAHPVSRGESMPMAIEMPGPALGGDFFCAAPSILTSNQRFLAVPQTLAVRQDARIRPSDGGGAPVRRRGRSSPHVSESGFPGFHDALQNAGPTWTDLKEDLRWARLLCRRPFRKSFPLPGAAR